MPSRIADHVGTRVAGHWPALLAALVGVVLAAIYFLPLPELVTEMAYDATGVLAVVAILVGVRRHRPAHAAPWLLIAGGIALFAIGDICWSGLSLADESLYPSVADVSYVLGYPVLTLAFLHIIVVRVSGGDRSGLLDAVIMAIAVSLIGFVRLLRPILDTPGDPLSLAVSVGYPIGDLIIIGVCIGLLASPGRRGLSFSLLLLSMAVQCLGDVVYAEQVAAETFVDGSLLDASWMASYILIAMAALVPSMRNIAEPHPVRIAWLSPLRLVLMTFAMLTGPVLILGHADPDIPLLVAGSAVLSLAVVARLAVTVRALAHDNAARRSLENELNYRATHDPLTGLSNRRRFMESLDAMLTETRKTGEPWAVLFLDLDDFKGINDTLGHASGDALLETVARRIRGQLRVGDLAARMGGDEFGIIVRAGEDVASRIAHRVLDSLSEPVAVAGRTVFARGSIGVAQVRSGATLEQLLADADIAMYRAKAQGKGSVCVYAPELREDVVDRMQLEADLRAAIARDALALEYQPIVDLRTGRPAGVEALIRWMHPRRGAVPPSLFIPLADSSGLAAALGTWVLDHACAQVAAWRAQRVPDLQLSVNLSPRQLAGPNLLAMMYDSTTRAGLPMTALMVDVTEGALLLEAPEVAANLAALRALGARVAIDDFGTGYSSLGHLGRLPVDVLKIDRAFVDRLATDEDRGIAGVVIQLAETLGLETVAEGIEKPEQLDAVRALGCAFGQGYLLAQPMGASALEAYLRHEPAADADASRVARAVRAAGVSSLPSALPS